jgi:cell wall-associated NlpC family hydrolase
VVVAFVAVLVATTVSLLGGAATASPTTDHLHQSIQQVSALLDKLGRQNEVLDERYNQAAALVATERRRAQAAARTARTAAVEEAQARDRLAMAAEQRYEAGSSDSTGLLLISQNPQDYLNNLSSMDYLSGQFATLRSSAASAARRAHTTAQQAAARLASARSKAQALRAQRGTLVARTEHFKQVLAGLTEQQRQAYARARSVALAQARAIAAAQAARARAQAQAAPTPAPAAPAPAPAGAGTAAVQRVVNYAEAQVGKAYTYAGTGPDSYDCSGLTMMSWRQAGVSLPHQASAQYNVGTHVSYDQLQPGDLIFLYHPISHVEIYVGHDLAVSAADPALGVRYVHPSQDMADYAGATRPQG